jgi:DNA-binding NarL/FixJ family response regulator
MGQQHLATVAIVEDHPVVIAGVKSWFAADPEGRVKVVAAGPTIESVIHVPADVLLLDLELGKELVTDRVGDLCATGQRVVVFSAHQDPDTVRAVLEAGASAFLSKELGTEDHCVRTILDAAADRPATTLAMAHAISTHEGPALSRNERIALIYWVQCMSKESVARRMGISESTVRQYIARARVKYAKIGRAAPTKEALLARAIEDGLITADEVYDYISFAREPRESA